MRGCFGVLSAFDGDRLFIVRVDTVLCMSERSLNRVSYAERSLNRCAHIIA
jgi:hypothetical protein